MVKQEDVREVYALHLVNLFALMHKEDESFEVGSDLFPMMQQEDSTPDKMRYQVLSSWIWEMFLAVNGGY